MNLPDAKAGNPVLAEDIQRICAAIKQIRLRTGTGYFLRESSGGTTINFPPETIGGTGGGGSVIPCPFQCTDASDETTLKVEVAWGLIYQQLPLGMMPNNKPPLRLTVTETCYIYSLIVFDTDTLLVTGVSFSVKTTIQSNTDTTQYNLIAVVTVSEGEDKTITSISNICQQPFPSPCSLAPA
jgi:hypothetical protein